MFFAHAVTPHGKGDTAQQGAVTPDGHGDHAWTAADLAALLRGGRGATLPCAPGSADAKAAAADAAAGDAATAGAANADAVAAAADVANLSGVDTASGPGSSGKDTASIEKADRLTDAKVAQALAQRLLASGASASQLIEALSGQAGTRSKDALDDLIRQALLATEQKPSALNPASRLVVSLTSAAAAASSTPIAGGEIGSALGASAELLPTETTDQIIQAIRLQMTRGGGDAQIRLEPRIFGDLTVSVHVDQGQVVARLSADTAVVREWLQANEHVLRQNLANQHLTLTRLEVGEPSAESRQRAPRDGNNGQAPSEERPARRPRTADTGETFDVVA